MLTLPMEYPKGQTRRKAKLAMQNGSISRDPLSHAPHRSLSGDAMLERLWNGDTYISERYFQRPLTRDAMLSRLWSHQRYPTHMYFKTEVDPMLDRLWNNETYRHIQTDPMLKRLWSDERYRNSAEEPEFDTMLHRLWRGIMYPADIYISSIHDPMLSRLWDGQRYTQSKPPSHYDDPMLARLWNGEMHDYRRRKEAQDPMMQRLWAATRYREDPMIRRLWTATQCREDPMSNRLWAHTRYREDPMISRLRATVTYQEDSMLGRLWNGDSYFDEKAPRAEFHNVVFTSEPSLKSPKPWSPIPKGLYLHSGKYPAHHVSEMQDSSDEEDEVDVTASKRQSGVFTAFFNSIKTDIPLVNDFLKNQEYDTVPIADPFGDEYVQHESIIYHAPDEQHVHFEDLLPSDSHDYNTESDEEDFPFRSNSSSTAPSSTPLRIQTATFPLPPHTKNPFDSHFPSSGAPSSPATPSDTASHAFQELDPRHDHEHERGAIPDSWSPPREELHLTPRVRKAGGGGENEFAGYVSYVPPPSVASGEHKAEGARSGGKRGVGNHFNSVPQNPRLSVAAEGEGVEDDGSGAVGGRAAFLGRLSKMYYGGSGEERGKLLDRDRER